MSHIRTQIRAAFKEALDNNLPANEYRVFASRKAAINHDPDLATVTMQFLNDQTRNEETMDTKRIHVPSLYVRIQRSANEANIDDALDQDEVNVITAIRDTDWSELLTEHPEIMQANFTDDASAGNLLGGIVLRFDLEYRIERDDPENTIE